MADDRNLTIKWNITKNMTELRKAYPLTQAELAEKINYSDKAVSKWERGECIPDVIVLSMLAELYGVTMEYFLADHSGEKIAPEREKKQISKTHVTITLIVIAAVWLLATAAFIITGMIAGFSGLYLIFIGALPVTAILILIFNTMWGKRKYNIIIESVIIWTVLLFLCLSLLNYNIWVLFIIGVPTQIVIILVNRLIANIISEKSNKQSGAI